MVLLEKVCHCGGGGVLEFKDTLFFNTLSFICAVRDISVPLFTLLLLCLPPHHKLTHPSGTITPN